MALVVVVIDDLRDSRSKLYVSDSASIKIGTNFACFIARIVAMYVLEATNTSSPMFKFPKILDPSSISLRASNPFPTPIQCFVPQYAANSFSNSSTSFPKI